MAISHMPFQTEMPFGMPDGVTNTHVRKQIRRIRLSKGWTKQDLEEAAGIGTDSLEDLEAGIRHISVDTLRKIIDALESDITEVWPSHRRVNNVDGELPNGHARDPLNFSRLAEVHSLTGAVSSCMFVSSDRPVVVHQEAEEAPTAGLRLLAMINLDDDEREWLCSSILSGASTGPWVTYLYSEDGRSMYLCLKRASLEFWAEGFIERCLAAWLTASTV